MSKIEEENVSKTEEVNVSMIQPSGSNLPEEIETAIAERGTYKQTVLDNILVLLTVLAVVAGVVLGLSLRSVWSHEEYRKLFYLEFPGRILLNMILMLIIPLTVSCLVTGMTNIGTIQSKNLGAATVAYYTLTTLLATIVGIVLVVIARPGYDNTNKPKKVGISSNDKLIDSMLDIISQCVPNNLIAACFQKDITVIKSIESNRTNSTGHNYTVYLEKPEMESQPGSNILGLVVFSIVLGLAINHVGDKGKPMKDFFESLNYITLALMEVILWYLPFGIMCLVATQFIAASDIWAILSGLGKFMGVVAAGLAIHACVALPLIYYICTKKSPLMLMLNTAKAMLTAFSTSSRAVCRKRRTEHELRSPSDDLPVVSLIQCDQDNSATLPVTMDCLINKCNISIDVVRFLIPVGATINMDGTALYEAVAAIYVAQYNHWDLGILELIIVSLTSTAGAVGTASVPQAGLGTLVIVLTAVGLPVEDAMILLSVDWLMDRLRTMVNVWGDCVGAAILDHRFRVVQAAHSAQLLAEERASHEILLQKETTEKIPDIPNEPVKTSVISDK